MGVEFTRRAPVEPVVLPGAITHVACETPNVIGREELEAELVLVEGMGSGERLRGAGGMEVEAALGAVVAEAGAWVAAGVTVEGGAALVRRGRKEGQLVLGVGRVGDEGWHLGTGHVEGEAAAALELAHGAAPACVQVAAVESTGTAGADGDAQIRQRLRLDGELEGVRVAKVVDVRLIAQLSHLSLTLSLSLSLMESGC